MKSRIRGLNPLLVILAVALVSVLFALACGEAEEATEAPEPTATAVPTTPSDDDAMDDDAMEDDAMEDDAMEDDAMEDDAMEDDAMDDGTMDDGTMDDDAMMMEPEGQYGGSLKAAYPTDHSLLDPAQAEAAIIIDALENVFEPLVRINPDASFTPVLATHWDISDDVKTYTFYLREGVKFHNGADFTADDVVWSLNRNRDPDISTQVAHYVSVENIVAVDDYTVRFEHSTPNGFFLDSLQLYQSVIMDSDTDIDKLNSGEEVYGTGPFMLAELLPEERVTMVRNPNYWEPKLPYLDELVFVGIAEPAARREALLTGEVDVIPPPVEPQQLGAFYANPNTQVYQSEGSGFIGIAINNQIPPFDNKLVRQALRYAVDRDLVNRVAFLGLGTPTNDSPVWPKDSRYAPEYNAAYDPDRARALLDQAGYPNGIEITINTADLGPGMLELPVVFKQSAAAAGIRVNIQRHPSSQFWSEIFPVGPLTVFWYSPRPNPNHVLVSGYHSKAKWGITYFDKHLVEGAEFAPYGSDIFTVGPLAQQLDALIERAAGETLEQQQITYREIQAFLADNVPQLAIAARPQITAAAAHVKNLELNPVSPNLYFDEVWLEQ